MTDIELLAVAERALADAIAEAEFSRMPKDLQFAQIVAEKVEKLRAKIAGREPVIVQLRMGRDRMCIEYTMGHSRLQWWRWLTLPPAPIARAQCYAR